MSGIPQWVYKPVAPPWATEGLEDELEAEFKEEDDDEKLRLALSFENGQNSDSKNEDANTVAAKSLLGPRILSTKAAARRKRKNAKKARRIKDSLNQSGGSAIWASPSKGSMDSLVVTGSVELAQEAARQLGENDAKFQHELLLERGKYAKAIREQEELKQQIISMQSAHELQLEVTIQTAEDHRLKERRIIERQKSEFFGLQVSYDKALNKIKEEEIRGTKQLEWFQSALKKKQNALDRQVNEKRKLEQTVVEMTKRQAELTSASLHKVDMTMRRVGRPSSASSHGSRSRYIVSSPEIMGRPSSASSSTRRSHHGSYSSGKKKQASAQKWR